MLVIYIKLNLHPTKTLGLIWIDFKNYEYFILCMWEAEKICPLFTNLFQIFQEFKINDWDYTDNCHLCPNVHKIM